MAKRRLVIHKYGLVVRSVFMTTDFVSSFGPSKADADGFVGQERVRDMPATRRVGQWRRGGRGADSELGSGSR
jgi:hypothetical protein